MKKAQIIALWVLFGLLLVTGVLLIGALKYGSVVFWAGMLAAAAQAVLAALAAWGLKLARQQAAMVEEATSASKFTPIAPLGSFYMSYSDDTTAPSVAPVVAPKDPEEIQSLDIGFQRVVIGLCSLVFVALAGIIAWLVWRDFSAIAPGKPIVISTIPLDPGAVVAAVGSLAIYVLLLTTSRVSADTEGFGEAANGIVLLGLPGSVVVAGAVICAWAGVAYASQAGAIFIGVVMVLQAMELAVNAIRNQGAIEELEQEGADLQKLPLVPLLTSGWIIGMRVLLAETIGATSQDTSAPGVMTRMLPRIFWSFVALVIIVASLHVVPTGEVAIPEHLGQTTPWQIAHPLKAGMHIMWPWPIDRLELVPTAKVQLVTVGSEEPKKSKLGQMAFSFWAEHESIPDHEFVTGDVNASGAATPQLMDGSVTIWWRVKNATQFFKNVSNSTIVAVGGVSGNSTRKELLPMYQALVRQLALQVVTQVFASHPLEDVMIYKTAKVDKECQALLQQQLDTLKTGIDVQGLVVRDVHPPAGIGQLYDPSTNQPIPGPAAAYELSVGAREQEKSMVDDAQSQAYGQVQDADGYAQAVVALGKAYAASETNVQQGKSAALLARAGAFTADSHAISAYEFYRALDTNGLFGKVNKVILGPDVLPPQIWQLEHSGDFNAQPAGGPVTGGIGSTALPPGVGGQQ